MRQTRAGRSAPARGRNARSAAAQARERPDWVDPRSDPRPPAAFHRHAVTADPGEIGALLGLCRRGRIYDIERWIQAGKPMQLAFHDVPFYQQIETALVVALESHQSGLALLLLCNGYRTDLEPHSPLNIALRQRDSDYVDLLLAWGADPTAADPEAVLDTYQVSLMERFWDLGCDLTRDRSLAYYLSERTSNKPAYGWAKRHSDDPRVAYALSLALNEAVLENREKAVALLVWAGADPHRRAPTLRYSHEDDEPNSEQSSPIEHAVMFGRGSLLKYLKPNPGLDDFEELWESVCDPDTLDVLFSLRPPRDWSTAIKRNISRMAWGFRDQYAERTCLERIFEHHWGRLNTLEPRESQDLRRDLLKIEYGSDFAWLLQKLAKPHHCDPRIFTELVRTPAMRERMTRHGVGALVPAPAAKHAAGLVAGPKQRQEKVQTPKERREAWLSSLTPEDREKFFRLVITREQLYAEVWADPVIKVAERYGVSDVAVGKWCRRLNVPRPGRGYWARKAAGRWVKQVALPESRTGHEEHVPRPGPTERPPKPPATVPGLELFEKPIPVPEPLVHEHPLVARTRVALAGSRTHEGGILRPQEQEVLDLRICEPSLERALRIMNALILALERAGFAVEAPAAGGTGHPSRANRTHAVIEGERIPFSIAETIQKVERPPNDQERAEMRRNSWKRGPFFAYVPTGKLSLQIHGDWSCGRHRRTWSDGKNRRLEDCLYSVVRGLLLSADALKRQHSGTEEPRILPPH